jgi:hypothetical protein
MLHICFLTYLILFKKFLKLSVCLLVQDTFLSPTSGGINIIIIIIIIIWGGGQRTNVWSHTSGYAETDSVPCYQRNISQSISFFDESKVINLQHDANHIDMVIPLPD